MIFVVIQILIVETLNFPPLPRSLLELQLVMIKTRPRPILSKSLVLVLQTHSWSCKTLAIFTKYIKKKLDTCYSYV